MANPKLVYIGLGSNLGDRAGMLERAQQAMGAAGVEVLRRSSLYETEPLGAPPPWFLNAVVEAQTEMLPLQLLHAIAKIEHTFGRRRLAVNAPRTLDLDILLYGSSVIRSPELEVPHPQLPFRKFVLVPLAELAPELRHPVLHKSMKRLLEDTPDTSLVRLWRPSSKG